MPRSHELCRVARCLRRAYDWFVYYVTRVGGAMALGAFVIPTLYAVCVFEVLDVNVWCI